MYEVQREGGNFCYKTTRHAQDPKTSMKDHTPHFYRGLPLPLINMKKLEDSDPHFNSKIFHLTMTGGLFCS